MTTRQALDQCCFFAAAHSNRLHSLVAVADSGKFTDEEFYKVVGSMPDVIRADLARAQEEFQKAKAEYEAHCASIGEPAYATCDWD